MDRNALASMLMPEGSGPQYNALAMPSQVMSAYSPTWRDQLASWLMGDQRPSPERSRLVEGLTGSTGLSGGSGFGVADIVPGGQVLAAQEAGRKGDYSGMVMGMVGGPAGKVPGRGQLANALAPEQPKGFTAYHGSRHDFDKFDMSKIGTGEGAQAYGHGLYFAENEGVANSYKDKLGGVGGNPNKWQHLDYKKINDLKRDPKMLDEELRLERGYSEMLRKEIADTPYEDTKRLRQRNLDLSLGKISELESIKDGGRLYEVRINADPQDFLDWDKPLSQQSEKVRGALKAAGAKPDKYADTQGMRAWMGVKKDLDSEVSGLLDSIKMTFGRMTLDQAAGNAEKRLSGKLRDAGIPGIKYLDQGSRNKPLEFASRAEAEAAGYRYGGQEMPGGRFAPFDENGLYVSDQSGTRNYVLFRDDVIDIVRKYGVAFATTLYGAEAVNQAMGPQPNARAGEQ